jgi:hypothetical protein
MIGIHKRGRTARSCPSLQLGQYSLLVHDVRLTLDDGVESDNLGVGDSPARTDGGQSGKTLQHTIGDLVSCSVLKY